MKRMLYLFAVIIAALGLASCGACSEYIEEVKTGYLGGCLDVTVDKVLSQTIPDGKWGGEETDDGKIIVEYKSKVEDIETSIQFTIIDENHFKVSGMSIDGIMPSTDEESALLVDSRYTQYYGNKYPDKAAIDMMPNESPLNLMNGISAAYADKAKNPIDISNYFDKSSDELKTTLSIEEKDGFLRNSEISLMYDDEAKKVNTATISGSRIYSLFGVQTFNNVEDALNKISDRFEKVSEQDGAENTKSVMLIRNNSEDSLSVTYDVNTSSITEITYVSNGLEGYRAEQERLKKEAEEKAKAEAESKISWENITGSSFVCLDCGGKIFIGVETDTMQPYIEASADDGMFSAYGTLLVISNSRLRYNDIDGSFDVVIKDNNTIVVETNSLKAFAGTYKKYSWIQAG